MKTVREKFLAVLEAAPRPLKARAVARRAGLPGMNAWRWFVLRLLIAEGLVVHLAGDEGGYALSGKLPQAEDDPA